MNRPKSPRRGIQSVVVALVTAVLTVVILCAIGWLVFELLLHVPAPAQN
ncbi:hypothetical protein VMT65_07845 [Nocardia sp. CDC153]|nr:hypothetical protein [Nocardia sp. CDC153]MEC3952938.1 hypothetical protein [Nocardia sp. CDC153]